MTREPRAIVRRHPGAWLWRYSVRVEDGITVWKREDGGPHAFTRARAERKARRMLARYLRLQAEIDGEYDEVIRNEPLAQPTGNGFRDRIPPNLDDEPCPICGGDRLRTDFTGSGDCHAPRRP